MSVRRVSKLDLVRIAVMLTAATAGYCASTHDFQQGKLIEISTDERLDLGTSERWPIFTVQIADVVYTTRGGRLRQRRSGDPGHGMIVGDPVQVVVEGEQLIFLAPGGKELKTRIIKRTRAQ
jgi:hypothetical protein